MFISKCHMVIVIVKVTYKYQSPVEKQRISVTYGKGVNFLVCSEWISVIATSYAGILK